MNLEPFKGDMETLNAPNMMATHTVVSRYFTPSQKYKLRGTLEEKSLKSLDYIICRNHICLQKNPIHQVDVQIFNWTCKNCDLLVAQKGNNRESPKPVENIILFYFVSWQFMELFHSGAQMLTPWWHKWKTWTSLSSISLSLSFALLFSHPAF